MKASQARRLSLAAIAACMAGTQATAADLSFGSLAVTLECLGAEFYSYAAFGEGISEDLRAGGPASVGGRKANLSSTLQDIVEEMAEEKTAHVAYLRNVLGDDAPPCPAMDIGPAFNAAADAAAGMELSPPFDPYRDDTLFLHGAFLLQDVFATAYTGAMASDGARSGYPSAQYLDRGSHHVPCMRVAAAWPAVHCVPQLLLCTSRMRVTMAFAVWLPVLDRVQRCP
eukprot:jgi/Ulvmu1/12353/UM089_0037.1